MYAEEKVSVIASLALLWRDRLLGVYCSSINRLIHTKKPPTNRTNPARQYNHGATDNTLRVHIVDDAYVPTPLLGGVCNHYSEYQL